MISFAISVLTSVGLFLPIWEKGMRDRFSWGEAETSFFSGPAPGADLVPVGHGGRIPLPAPAGKGGAAARLPQQTGEASAP